MSKALFNHQQYNHKPNEADGRRAMLVMHRVKAALPVFAREHVGKPESLKEYVIQELCRRNH